MFSVRWLSFVSTFAQIRVPLKRITNDEQRCEHVINATAIIEHRANGCKLALPRAVFVRAWVRNDVV